MRRLAITIVLLLLQSYAFADTHYVSKTGSDTYPYTSWGSAADSIQKGINASSSGDTIKVGEGTYRETITMIPGITLLGSGMDVCTIYPANRSVRDIVYGADSAIIEGFYVKGWQPGKMEYCVGIRCNIDSKMKRVTNNKITNCDFGITMGTTNTTVVNNLLTDNDEAIAPDLMCTGSIISNTLTRNSSGIYFLSSATLKIIKNIVSDVGAFEGIAGSFFDSVFIENNLVIGGPEDYAIDLSKFTFSFVNAPVRNNTVSGNSWHSVISVTFTNEIKNNMFMNGLSALEAYRYSSYSCSPQVSYNNMWNNLESFKTVNGATIDTSLGGNIYLDPMFVGGDDYYLQYGSPCINAGDPNIKDPDSSRSDMGCYGGAYGDTYTYLDYPPKPPDSLSAVSESTIIILNWKPNTESDLSYYLVYKDTIAGFIPDPSKIVANISKDSSIFIDYDFVLGKTYYYRVSAWDLTGYQSEYSDELEVKATSVDEYIEQENHPPMYQLSQNYPNPFNSETVIWYFLPDVGYQPAEVEITIYNLLGNRVKSLVNGREYPGEHKARWDAKDDSDNEVASGIYFYRLKVSGLELVKAKKMVLLK